MKKLLPLFMAATTVAGPFFFQREASAADTTGNTMLARCRASLQPVKEMEGTDFQDSAWCLGYLEAVRDTNNVYRANKLTDTPLFCLPNGGSLNNLQAVRIVVKYLEDHPESLHKPYGLLSSLAFLDAFPCSKASE